MRFIRTTRARKKALKLIFNGTAMADEAASRARKAERQCIAVSSCLDTCVDMEAMLLAGWPLKCGNGKIYDLMWAQLGKEEEKLRHLGSSHIIGILIQDGT
jgi:hypothetical protein